VTVDLPEAAVSSPELDLEAAVAAQAVVIVELRAVIAGLQAQVAELERQLGRNASNSSRPPSCDGLGKPAAAARQRRAGSCRPGKQPGAPGAHLARVEDPDEVVVHMPERCRGCGAVLVLAPVVGVEARQVLDLPEIGLRAVEHRAERRRCDCGTVTAAGLPHRPGRRPATALGSVGWSAI
jgi:transposase